MTLKDSTRCPPNEAATSVGLSRDHLFMLPGRAVFVACFSRMAAHLVPIILCMVCLIDTVYAINFNKVMCARLCFFSICKIHCNSGCSVRVKSSGRSVDWLHRFTGFSICYQFDNINRTNLTDCRASDERTVAARIAW